MPTRTSLLKVPPRPSTPKRPRQLELSFPTWGGTRRNAGRKPQAGRSSVPHRARPVHDQRHPVHVTLRAARRLPSLRKQPIIVALRRAFALTGREWHRKGNVFHHRYHSRALATPREVRHGLVYVLLNFRKHLGSPPGIDPASSGFWFDGWKRPSHSEPPGLLPDDVIPVQPSRTWLARVGWRRHGLIALHERPA